MKNLLKYKIEIISRKYHSIIRHSAEEEIRRNSTSKIRSYYVVCLTYEHHLHFSIHGKLTKQDMVYVALWHQRDFNYIVTHVLKIVYYIKNII